jgi:tetratricopeptide (TPR) repeat protein
VQRCERLLREGLEDPRAATAVLATLAVLEARRGRFDRARRLLAEAHDRAEDLGVRWLVAMVDWQAGRAESFAGDLAAAERRLRAVDATLAEIGAEGHRVTLTCDLARVLAEQGRDREALPLVERVREAAAPDDLITQLKWRAVWARTVARLGDAGGAEGLAREAVRLAERTDALETHGEALLDLAEVLRLGGRADQATAALREAERLFARKGNRPLAEQAAAALRALPRSGASLADGGDRRPDAG